VKPPGNKVGIEATKKLPGESRSHWDWPPLIKMDEIDAGVKAG
jgi:hypothetical protein